MNIWLVEPYYTGSHQAWADGYRAHSRNQVHLLTLSGHFWKWRMEGGAITLARLSKAIRQTGRRESRPSLRSQMARFDGRSVAPTYDAVLEQVAGLSGPGF